VNALATVIPSDVIAPTFARRLLAWAQSQNADLRADAASALARVYLYSGLTSSRRDEIGIVLTALLDDRCAMVRRAVAEAMSGAIGAPRHVAVALANDQSDVAAPVLLRSPALTDRDLADCAAVGDDDAQCAIARRPCLATAPAAALTEIGGRAAVLALLGNLGAVLTPTMLQRLGERFGDDAEVREALEAHPGSPATLKANIAIAKAKALIDIAAFTGRPDRERAERAAREARDKAVASSAAACGAQERADLVRSLRKRGVLTMALLLRSLLSGGSGLFAAALAELASLTHTRAAAFVRNSQGEGFAALLLKAGLPRHSLIAFRAALSALETQGDEGRGGLELTRVKATIAACEAGGDPALAPILSLLWRFAAEAAREEARETAREPIPDRISLPPRLDFSPVANDAGEPPALAARFNAAKSGAVAPIPERRLIELHLAAAHRTSREYRAGAQRRGLKRLTARIG
jgi:uncharacterized protein (DUF2336 family)